MSNNQIVVNPSTSGIQVSIDFQISSEHKKLVTKFRENLKLPERPLDLNTLFNAKLVALLTEDDEIKLNCESFTEKSRKHQRKFPLLTPIFERPP